MLFIEYRWGRDGDREGEREREEEAIASFLLMFL